LRGEGRGEGEESRNSTNLFIPLPFIPSLQGRGNFTLCEIIKIQNDNAKFKTKTGKKYFWILVCHFDFSYLIFDFSFLIGRCG